MSAPLFDLTGRPVVITGAGGLLGVQHSLAVAKAGGIPIAVDIDEERLVALSENLSQLSADFLVVNADVTSALDVDSIAKLVIRRYGNLWGLVNNVASNPPMIQGEVVSALETTSIESWAYDLNLGLTSAWLCGRKFGTCMAENGGGAIVNVASDLAVIAPDHRIYESDGLTRGELPKKPISYSVTKGGLRMMSKYFATYWAPVPVRSNCLMPGSVRGNQSAGLIRELENRIPLARLAEREEYMGAIVFLLSDASSYMTGADLIMDGGRSAW